MQRAFSGIMLTLLLTGLLTLAFNVQPVKASGATYIRPDGSVDPSTAPIQREEDVYTLTGDVTSDANGIVVQRDNIVVDGAGYSIQGRGIGIDLDRRSNVTIRNTNIRSAQPGFYGGYGGIRLYQSSEITLVGNNITENSWYGIVLYESSHNMLKNNHLADNGVNFGVVAYTLSDFINDVDASNMVEGKPIYYWINKQETVVPSDAGYVALVNCTGIEVHNLNLTKNWQGVLLAETTNSTITQNNITAMEEHGVTLYQSSNDRIVQNNITGNRGNGIYFYNSSKNTISANYLAYNGIFIEKSSLNVIDGNNVTNSGVMLSGSTNNTISANDVAGNKWWDDYGIELTYTSSWVFGTQRSDNNTIVGNNVTGNNGGIVLRACYYSTVVGNNVVNNTATGVQLETACYTTLRENTIAGNGNNFGVFTSYDEVRPSTYIEDIDTSNTVNGKPIYYLVNQEGLTIDDSDIGYLGLVNCTDIRIRDVTLSDNGQGLLLAFTNNSTIENVTVTDNRVGIHVLASDANTISASNITDNRIGVSLYRASSNKVTENILTDNGISIGSLVFGWGVQWTSSHIPSEDNIISNNKISNGGISLSNPGTTRTLIADNNMTGGGIELNWYTSTNVLTGNNITNGYSGIVLDGSADNLLRNNMMTNNAYNFMVKGGSDSNFTNDVDVSNTVDGKPICYWINKQDMTVPVDAGYLALVDSYNITVQGLQLKNNGQGILLVNTTNSRIVNNRITNNYDGIDLLNSLYDTLSGNNITENYNGIWLVYSSNNNLISNNVGPNDYCGVGLFSSENNSLARNTVANALFGIGVLESSNNTLVYNKIANNTYGIDISRSSNNVIYHNTFVNNTVHAYIEYTGYHNIWDNGYPSGGNCWSDYAGVDANGDGVGETSYIIDQDNLDSYPLTEPYVLLGDLSNDGAVNMLDVAIFGKAYGSSPGHPRWNSAADLDANGIVNILDGVLVAKNFGKKW